MISAEALVVVIISMTCFHVVSDFQDMYTCLEYYMNKCYERKYNDTTIAKK